MAVQKGITMDAKQIALVIEGMRNNREGILSLEGERLTAEIGMDVYIWLAEIALQLPAPAQALAFERLGIQMPPMALEPETQTHEITEESEGLDPNTGVPVKRKVSVVKKPLN